MAVTEVTRFAKSQFIPHPMMLFAAGTYEADGSANLTLVSWMSFYWDGGLGITLCLDGDKAVKRNLERTGWLTLNALTREQTKLVDALGRASGPQKAEAAARFNLTAADGSPAPELADSPLVYEVELARQLEFDGSTLYFGRISAVRSAVADAGEDGTAVYDIVAASPLLASQRDYCCLTEGDVLGPWC